LHQDVSPCATAEQAVRLFPVLSFPVRREEDRGIDQA
jgi:hypothetical protein